MQLIDPQLERLLASILLSPILFDSSLSCTHSSIQRITIAFNNQAAGLPSYSSSLPLFFIFELVTGA
jgi:hypothetical protein